MKLWHNANMSSDTFKTKLAKLIQKSRKAIRIYSAVGRDSVGRPSKPYSDMQLKAWYNVNEELLIFLQEATTKLHLRQVATETLKYAQKLSGQLLPEQTKFASDSRLLVQFAESGDFVNSAKLSQELIVLKAKIEAKKAVLEELGELLSSANLKMPVTHQMNQAPQESLRITESKIIPFRTKKIGI